MEVHGTVEWMQCTRPACKAGLWYVDPNAPSPVTIDKTTMRAVPPLPECSSLARPKILMFGDAGWDENRTWQQEIRFNQWRSSLSGARVVVIECGAGKAIPTVRHLCDYVAHQFGGKLIRLNIREPEVPDGEIGISIGALAGLRAIDERLGMG